MLKLLGVAYLEGRLKSRSYGTYFSVSNYNCFFLVRLFGNTIRGFLVQARMPGDTPSLGVNPMLLGSFQPVSGQQTLDCDLMAGAADEIMLTLIENAVRIN